MKSVMRPRRTLREFKTTGGEESLRKILVIGERGIGKSAILNKLYGCRQVQSQTNPRELVAQKGTMGTPFSTKKQRGPVTEMTEFVVNPVFGLHENPEYMFIDMPGVLEDIENDENIQINLDDLTSKLQEVSNYFGKENSHSQAYGDCGLTKDILRYYYIVRSILNFGIFNQATSFEKRVLVKIFEAYAMNMARRAALSQMLL